MKTDLLRELDEPSAAMRILLELSKTPQGINITILHGIMSARGVGRTAVDSSRRALIAAGLAEEDRMKNGKNKTLTILSTTFLGSEVARKLLEVQDIMSKVSQNQSARIH